MKEYSLKDFKEWIEERRGKCFVDDSTLRISYSIILPVIEQFERSLTIKDLKKFRRAELSNTNPDFEYITYLDKQIKELEE